MASEDRAEDARSGADMSGEAGHGTWIVTGRLLEVAQAVADGTLSGPDSTTHVLSVGCAAIPGARRASITEDAESSGTKARTIAATDPLATAIDTIQYASGEGPCLQAIARDSMVIGDLTDVQEWPVFAARTLAEGHSGSVLSYPLTRAGRANSSLNVYADAAGAFAGVKADSVAPVAATLVLALTTLEERANADHLRIALQSNRRIGAAIGIIMFQRKLTFDEAFASLRLASQNGHRKLREIAEEVLYTGRL